MLLTLRRNLIVALNRFWARFEIAVGFTCLALASTLLHFQPGTRRSWERDPVLGLIAAFTGGVAMLLLGAIDEIRTPGRTRIIHQEPFPLKSSVSTVTGFRRGQDTETTPES